MPRLPEIEQRTRISGVGPGPGPVDNRGVYALGEATQAIGRDVLAVKVNDIQNSWQLADTTAKTLGELNAFGEGLASDDDYDTHGQKFVDKAKEIEARTKESFQSPLMYKIWRDDFRRAARAGELQVAVNAQKLKTAKVRTDLGNTLETLADQVGVSPEQDAIVRAQALVALESNRVAGNLDYSERDALLDKFTKMSDETPVRRAMIADPIAAERALAAGEFPQLKGEARALWAQRLATAAETEERRRVTEAEHQQTRAEHEQKLAGAAAAKDGLTLFANGQLTPSWIEANSDVLSVDDKKYFYSVLRNPPGSESAPANVEQYADLRSRAGLGEDVRDEAKQALLRGSIRASDYDRIVGEVESERPGWRRAGDQYLGTVSGYSELNPTPGAAQLKATMLDEWAQWADQHPNATPDEARKTYLAIGESHQLADEAVKVLTFPMPTYAAGDRQRMLDPAVLQATAARTKQALDSGEITPDEYSRQAAIWKQWNDLAQRKKTAP